MTDAVVEPVPPDVEWAKVHLARGEELIHDAKDVEGNAGRQIILHAAIIALMESVLQAAGRRVKSGDGHHRLIIEEVERALDVNDPSLFARLQEVRTIRNAASYHAGIVSEDDVSRADGCAETLLPLVEDFVAS